MSRTLSQKVDGLIISGGPLEAAPEALDAAKAAHVPVVLVDRDFKGGDYTSWIGPDNYAIGVGIGNYIAKRLGGKGTVVVLRGGPADNSIGLARTNGMLSVVEKTDIKVEKGRLRRLERRWRVKLMDEMLAKNPNIRPFFANNSMCQGAQKAIKDARRSDQIFLGSVDGEKGTLKEIMSEATN